MDSHSSKTYIIDNLILNAELKIKAYENIIANKMGLTNEEPGHDELPPIPPAVFYPQEEAVKEIHILDHLKRSKTIVVGKPTEEERRQIQIAVKLAAEKQSPVFPDFRKKSKYFR